MGYEANALSAAKTLAKKGLQATLLRQKDVGFDPVLGDVVAPASPASETVAVVVLPPDLGVTRYSDGPTATIAQSKVQRKKVLMAGTVAQPQIGDSLTFGGSRWTIEGVGTLSPGGVNVLYTLGVVST